MHVLATLFVLVALFLTFGVIGGMIFANQERIREALRGGSPETQKQVIFARFGKPVVAKQGVSRAVINDRGLLPLAA